MLHSTQTTKKHTGNLILRFGMAGLLAAGLFFSAPYSAAAETVPSAENTDAGEITIHFTHDECSYSIWLSKNIRHFLFAK